MHAGHRAVAVLPSAGGADLATAAVIQHGPCAALRPAAPLRVASVRAVDGILDAGAPSRHVPQQERGEHRDDEHRHPGMRASRREAERGDSGARRGSWQGCAIKGRLEPSALRFIRSGGYYQRWTTLFCT